MPTERTREKTTQPRRNYHNLDKTRQNPNVWIARRTRKSGVLFVFLLRSSDSRKADTYIHFTDKTQPRDRSDSR